MINGGQRRLAVLDFLFVRVLAGARAEYKLHKSIRALKSPRSRYYCPRIVAVRPPILSRSRIKTSRDVYPRRPDNGAAQFVKRYGARRVRA